MALDVRIYVDVDGKYVLDAPPATILPSILVSSYQPDIAVCNEELNTIFLLELMYLSF